MVEVINLVKIYGENTALAGVNLSVGKGEIAGLLGPNGAGKSTLMKILSGYTSPDKGSVKLFGFEMSEDAYSLKKRVGYLPETPPLYFDMTVEEQLRFQCGLKGVPKNRTVAEIDHVCDLLQIGDVKKRLIKNLSKGYKQRTGFAGALVGCPELLILDEPSSGLDPLQIMDMRMLIAELGKKMTILISSHILSEIASVCSRILIMKNGLILADGTPHSLEHRYTQTERILITVRGAKERAELLLSTISEIIHYTVSVSAEQNFTDFTLEAHSDSALREKLFNIFENSGLALTRIQPLSMTLEDIFINLTGKNY